MSLHNPFTDPSALASLIDHTNLAPDATTADFEKLCDEAAAYGFAMVAINPAPVALCARLLEGSSVHVGAAIGFPLGQITLKDKINETRHAIENGANEIDYVINIGEMKNGNFTYIEDEMAQIVEICRDNDVLSKVIFENCYLNEAEKKSLCTLARRVRPDFIKTSTGFGPAGAILDDVALMHNEVKGLVQVKAAGGIRRLDSALSFVEAGARRIGTSRGTDIIDEFRRHMES